MKIQKDKISFVIVLYNHSLKLVMRAINSIRECMLYCPYYDYEIVIINNLKEKVYDFINTDLDIKYHISEKNLGYCGGNNFAIRNIVTGNYIIIMNPDIKINNSLCIDWLIGGCKLENKICGRLIGTNEWYTYAASFPTDKKYEPDLLPFYFMEHTLNKPGDWRAFKYIDGCLMAFSKELFFNIGGFDEDFFPGYFGETAFAFKAFLVNNKFSLFDSKINDLYEHSENDSEYNQFSKIVEWTETARKLFYSKYALQNWDKFLQYLNL